MGIEQGELTAIIGPNGAGKTTLFNQITGYIAPDNGNIFFDGLDITGKDPEILVKMGIVRAFQVASLFIDETVYDNLYLAALAYHGKNGNFFTNRRVYKDVAEHCHFILEKLGLSGKEKLKAFELSHGDQKVLDIAIALTMKPKLLLLDEPTAGMSPDERVKMTHMIRNIHEEFKLTTVFVEHDMDMVFGIADIIRVLVHGELIAEGNAEEIQKNPAVIDAYLGHEVL
ncbi:MAG: ABC transporter ATP-binding protein [Geobacter sp.]|nr:ABC transporter ATP-binding protein [Geobacter sp.]